VGIGLTRTHMDRERGFKTGFSCGRYKWMTPAYSRPDNNDNED